MTNIIPFPDPSSRCKESSGSSERPNAISVDELEIGKTYTFNPPLHIATVDFTTKVETSHGLRHPNFLAEEIIAAGLSKGEFICLNKPDEDGTRCGVFVFTYTFFNTYTNERETVSGTAGVKFSKKTGPEAVPTKVTEVAQAVEGALEPLLLFPKQ